MAHLWHVSGQTEKQLKTDMKKAFFTFAVSILLTPLHAQEPMSLEDCMAYAVEHSTTVGQQVNSLESSRQDYISAVASALPSIGASTGGNVSFGRSIDPETNTYTTTSTFSNSYGISASMTVFNGLSTINSIRATKVLRAKGAEDPAGHEPQGARAGSDALRAGRQGSGRRG